MREILERFMREFKERTEKLPNVERVEFFGSITTPNWKLGESDVDVIVYGNNIPGATKREIVLILRELNQKYGLQLENVRCCHPTPFFLDSAMRKQQFKEMMRGHSVVIELGRTFCKQYGPTCGFIWAIEDGLKEFENRLPPLPPPFQKLSEIFDKFR